MEAVGLSGRSVLVTGGDGLLGAWLVKALLERGARVVAIRRDAAGRLGARAARARRPRRRGLRRHLRPTGLIARALNEYEVDSVFHLAAQTLVGTANRAPAVDVRDQHPRHLAGARGVPAARGRAGRRGLLRQGLRAPATSSPTARTTPLQPRFPYDVSKAAARHDRALVLAHVRAAGGGHAVREPVRRRRTQSLTAGPGGGLRRARRPAAGDPLRRLARARLPVRGGRRRAPIWRSGRLLGAGRARRGVQRRRWRAAPRPRRGRD